MEKKEKRESSFELLRIIVMLIIVAHHYVVNSGLLGEISHANLLSLNSVFAILFGWGGKTGINCFVLITGYFMCKSNITAKKLIKLVLEIEFYNIGIYLIFILSGNVIFSLSDFVKLLIPFYGIGTAFIPSYLVFYLFIPYLNILIKGMSQNEHWKLICLIVIVDCLFQTLIFVPNAFTYVGWFMGLYAIGAYIRLYPSKWLEDHNLWKKISVVSVVASLISVLACIFISYVTNRTIYYWFVSDSNKFMAIVTSISVFVYFKTLNVKYNKVINTVASTTFGVLLIHAHSGQMSSWLWGSLLKNRVFFSYSSVYFIFHAVLSCILVFTICSCIDIVRQRVFEKPVLTIIEKIIRLDY